MSTLAEIVYGITSEPCKNQGLTNESGEPYCRPDCRVWTAADGRYEYDLSSFPEPTADDMLDWLRERGVMLETDLRHESGGYVVTMRGGFDGTQPTPTLHAALEAAVRAIDDSPQQGAT